MGCSSSTLARGRVDMSALPAPARPERRHSLPSCAASALGSLGLCRDRHDGLHPYTTLPLEETVSGEAAYGAPSAEAMAASLNGDAAAWPAEGRAPMKLSPCGILEGAASATSSTAHWPTSATSTTAQFSSSPSWFRGESSPPPPVQFVAPDFDPAILSVLREALVGPSPYHPAVLFPEKEATTPLETTALDEVVTPAARDMPEVTGLVRARVDEFYKKLVEKKEMKEAEAQKAALDATDEVVAPPPTPRKAVVVYFTSIRGVRKTFADGAAVRAILCSYRVRVDERDVSMHAAFKDELGDLVGIAGHVLPRVFVFGDGEQQLDLGGADEVSALHESGELAHALAGCEAVAAHLPPCAGCGDLRFLPCGTCSGSGKLFAGDEGGCLAAMFEECTHCNENGLIRCPVCCL